MDEIVRQAMTKWPNVPHCFGWLRLDARGGWRMRDERAQHLNLPGERISHPALLAFIERNYAGDEQGRWHFQNGPQRVYVDLELTPYIVRTQPGPAGAPQLVFHTGETVGQIDAAWLDEHGRLYIRDGEKSGGVDDRDMAQLLPHLQVDDDSDENEEALLRWLEGDDSVTARLVLGTYIIDLQRIRSDHLAQQFNFTATPRQA
ncbi:DUF2946 family protein [Herbaspirillum sp. LeCh32-8]|uniref:DUF2946 family protein n=1 Tax=Herbaspirillum sp. LeCh32-8 TaxID=2821356 RepID=UPI001AE4179E|nr:DUF2946 family protein [Herbaspirillum sp. LeCh32-8]MBP0600277.1 DUF2946 family protein [Herbaspirillum sp. LeCh32-8]